MSEWHKVCEDCPLNHGQCLLQDNNDVDDCQDVKEAKNLEGKE